MRDSADEDGGLALRAVVVYLAGVILAVLMLGALVGGIGYLLWWLVTTALRGAGP